MTVVALSGSIPVPLPDERTEDAARDWAEELLAWGEACGKKIGRAGIVHAAHTLDYRFGLLVSRTFPRVSSEGTGTPETAVAGAETVPDRPEPPRGADRPAATTVDDRPARQPVRTGGKGAELFGHPLTAVMRWMGKAGWTWEQGMTALGKLGIAANESTVKTQVGAGKKGLRGEPAALTADQIRSLESARG